MFTTEPSLAQRIGRMINDTPIIDAGSRISCGQPNAPNLASLLGEPSLRTDLLASGMPESGFDARLPSEERVHHAIPYLKRVRNTTASWCLFRIFRDLYDFHESQLTESNVQHLHDRVAKSSLDPAWSSHIIRERCNLKAVVTRLEKPIDLESKNPLGLILALDLSESLDRTLKEHFLTAAALDNAISDLLDKMFAHDVHFTLTATPGMATDIAPDKSRIDALLSIVSSGGPISALEVETLSAMVSSTVFRWHHDRGRTLRIELREARFSSLPPISIDHLARLFDRFDKARFELTQAPEQLVVELTALARRRSNVYLSGFSVDSLFPGSIEAILARWIQIVPMTRILAFQSNAMTSEWIYARLQLLKKSLASVIAHLVENGYYEEYEVPAILRQILHDTPSDVYTIPQ